MNVADDDFRQSIQLFEIEQKKQAALANNDKRFNQLKMGETLRMSGIYSSLDLSNRLVDPRDIDQIENDEKGLLTPHKLANLDMKQRDITVPKDSKADSIYPKI